MRTFPPHFRTPLRATAIILQFVVDMNVFSRSVGITVFLTAVKRHAETLKMAAASAVTCCK